MDRYTIRTFNQDFPDDDACLDFVTGLIYPDGVNCRTCGEVRLHHRLSNRKAYSCDHCGTHVYPLAGTIFEKSSTPLKSWFYAMYLMAQSRCGISAKHLQRELGVTYKTAWRMFKQIRSLLEEDPRDMGGTLEADETYVGGSRKGKKGARRGRPGPDSHKVPVFGVVERGGRVMAVTVPNVRKASLTPHVEHRVMPAST